MLTFRVEHPNNGVGPWFNDRDDIPSHHTNRVRMNALDYLMFNQFTKQSDRKLPPSPMHDIKATINTGTQAMRQSILNFESRLLMPDRNHDIGLIWGFHTRDQFDLWFVPEALAICKKYGYQEAAYEVPDDKIMLLNTQCCWLRRESRLLNRQPIVVPKQKVLQAA